MNSIEAEKEFLKTFSELCRTRQAWSMWSDLVTAMACSISNACDRTQKHFDAREKEYEECMKRIGSVEKASKLLALIVCALEDNPEQDFLGKLYMQLGLGDHWKGQFFTPYSICKMMADIQCDEMTGIIDKSGYASVCDPACGAGATLIAVVNKAKTMKYNMHNHVLFVGQDLDRVAGLMCWVCQVKCVSSLFYPSLVS